MAWKTQFELNQSASKRLADLPDVELTRLFDEVGHRMTLAGFSYEAVEFVKTVTQNYSRLAADDPVTFRALHARSMQRLGSVLSGAGLADEGIVSLRQAAAASRTAGDPAILGKSLSELGVQLYLADKIEESVTVGREAVAVLRTAPTPSPSNDLTVALWNNSVPLWISGRRTEAADAGAEAIELFHALVQNDPEHREAYRVIAPLVANRLTELGRGAEAAAVLHKIELSPLPPPKGEQELAAQFAMLDAMLDGARRFLALGQDKDAAATAEQAIRLYSRPPAESAGWPGLAEASKLRR